MNKFTHQYNKVIDSDREFTSISINNGEDLIYKYPLHFEDLYITYEIAKEKCNFTHDFSQSGLRRDYRTKLVNSFKGALAELVVHQFFLKMIKEDSEKIKRYDIERNSFVLKHDEEYDLMLTNHAGNHTIEVRSSLSYQTTIEEFFNQNDIIGPYITDQKAHEDISDINVRPVFQYKKFYEKTDDFKKNFIEDIAANQIEIYIVSGAFKSDFEEHGYIKNMGQNQTQYNCIRIVDVGDAFHFIKRYKEKFQLH